MAAQLTSTNGCVGAVADEVNGAADEFFAGAAFAIDQDAAVGGGHDGDLFAQRFHRNAFADDVEAFFELVPKHVVRLFEPAVRKRVAGGQQRVFERQRFLDEVVCAELGCRDSRRDRGMAGDHDDVGPRRFFPDAVAGSRARRCPAARYRAGQVVGDLSIFFRQSSPQATASVVKPSSSKTPFNDCRMPGSSSTMRILGILVIQ